MGFLGISGKTWKKVGKIALQVAPIVAAPFTGGASLLALGAGTGAVSGALGGGGWKGALMGGALGAIPGGGGAGAAGGAAAKGVAKAGLKEIAKSIGKGAATNFVTGVGTSLATGQSPKQALASGGQSALSGVGSAGPTGGLKNIATTVGKNIATQTGGTYAARGLQKAGVPGALAGQGGNVFSQYLGNSFTPSAASAPTSAGGSAGGGQPVTAKKPGISSYLPQTAQPQPAQAGGGGGSWKDALLRAGTGAITGAVGGGGWKGAATGAQNALVPTSGGGGQQGGGQQGGGGGYASQPNGGWSERPMNSVAPTTGGRSTGGGASPTYPDATVPQPRGGWGRPSDSLPPPDTAYHPDAPYQPAAKTPPDPNRPATWAERYGPLIAQGAGVAVGAAVGRQAQKNALQRSPEEQAALTGAQGAAGQAGQLGGELAQQGRDYLQKPGQYFSTLLSGDRAAQAQAIATPTAALTGIYRGAQRNLDQQGIRGAARDVAAGDLNRERASKIAGLTTGVQPYAAEQLAKMGSETLSQAPGLLGTAGNIYSGLLNQGARNREYSRQEGAATAGAIGGLARDAGEVVFRRPQAGATQVPQTTSTGGGMKTPQGGTVTAPPPATSSGPTTSSGQTPAPVAPSVLPGASPPAVQGGTLRGPTPPNVTFGGVPAPVKPRNPYNVDFGTKQWS